MSEPASGNLLIRLLSRLAESLEDARSWLGASEMRKAALAELGLDPNTELPLPPSTPLPTFKDADTSQELLHGLATLVKVADELREFLKAVDSNPDGAIAEELFALMSLDTVRLRWPVVFFVAQALSTAQEAFATQRVPVTAQDDLQAFLSGLKKLFTPPSLFGKSIGPSGWETPADTRRFGDAAFMLLAAFPVIFGPYRDVGNRRRLTTESQGAFGPDDRGVFAWLGELDLLYGWDRPEEIVSTTPIADEIAQSAIALRLGGSSGEDANAGFVPEISFLAVPRSHGGPGLLISVGGAWKQEWEFGEGNNWISRIDISSQAAFDVFLGSDAKFFHPFDTVPECRFTLARKPNPAPPLVLGLNDGARIEFGELAFEAAINDRAPTVRLRIERLALVIDPGTREVEGRCMPRGGLRLEFPLRLQFWPKFGFESGDGLRLSIPLGLRVGPVEVPFVTVETRTRTVTAPGSDDRKVLEFEIAAAVSARLGPITLTLDRIGFSAALDPEEWKQSRPGLGFKPPSGVGVAVRSKHITGGGFLLLDHERGEYGGVLELAFRDLRLVAIGIIGTKPSFSLLAIVSVEGMHWAIGLGFEVTGLGGLLGIDRTFNPDVFRDGIRNGTLDRILFPKNAVANAPAIIATSTAAFPPARDRTIFGALVQVRWAGTSFVTIQLGVVIELETGNVLIVGTVRVVAPTEQSPLVDIRIDVVGEISPTRNRLLVVAALHHSRVGGFELSGGAAALIEWGEASGFLLSFGGFNPRFAAPAGFPKLDRLVIALANNDHLRLRFESYIALTSNTFQLGGALSAYASAGKFSIEGIIALHALFDFDSGSFVIDVFASLQLKAWGVNLFKVTLEGSLTGPGPWHLVGKATFSIWIFDYSIDVDHSTGAAAAPPALPNVDVESQVLAALRDPSSLSTALPTGVAPVVRTRTAQGGGLLLHPLGQLVVRQRIVPLGVDITRFQRGRPSGAKRFELRSATVRGQAATVTPLTEQFARAQYFDVTEDEAYGSPSFERFAAGASIAVDAAAHATPVDVDLGYETFVRGDDGQTRPLDGLQPPKPNLFDDLRVRDVRGVRNPYRDPARAGRRLVTLSALSYVNVNETKVATEEGRAEVGATSGTTHADAGRVPGATVGQRPVKERLRLRFSEPVASPRGVSTPGLGRIGDGERGPRLG